MERLLCVWSVIWWRKVLPGCCIRCFLCVGMCGGVLWPVEF